MFDTNLAAHLAELSKLKFTQKELEKITAEMETIVNLMDIVSSFDDSETLGNNEPIELKNTRPDKVDNSMPREEILKNSAEKSDTCFTVPKIV